MIQLGIMHIVNTLLNIENTLLKTEKENWQFVFLSADMDSINDAREYGI